MHITSLEPCLEQQQAGTLAMREKFVRLKHATVLLLEPMQTLMTALVLSVADSAADIVSNPVASPQSCGMSTASYICDPKKELPTDQRTSIAKEIAEFNEGNLCGQCIAVAVIPKIEPKLPIEKAPAKTKELAKKLVSGGWNFSICESLVVIIVNTRQRYIWLQPSQSARLCSRINEIFSNHNVSLSKGKFGPGIKSMIASYVSGFNVTYTTNQDCTKDIYPCTLQLSDLKELLPSPAMDKSKCNIPKGDFICDPHKVINESSRSELAQMLTEANNQSKCGQCVLVALLNGGDSRKADLKDLAKYILGNGWQYPKCQAKLLILAAKQRGFIWLQGTRKTMFCSKLTNISQDNKKLFISGDVYKFVQRVTEAFVGAVSSTKNCQQDMCNSTGSGDTSKKGGNAASDIEDALKDVLKFVVDHKMIVIGLATGLLVLLGTVLGLSFICCRKKTMGLLRRIVSAARKHIPRLIEEIEKEFGGGKRDAAEDSSTADTKCARQDISTATAPAFDTSGDCDSELFEPGGAADHAGAEKEAKKVSSEETENDVKHTSRAAAGGNDEKVTMVAQKQGRTV